jgi:hypothetical protein
MLTMESFGEELFVDEGSEWSPSESSSTSCNLSDDWSMDSHLRNKNEGITELDNLETEFDNQIEEARCKKISEMTLNDMVEAMWPSSRNPLWDRMEDTLERDPRSARVWGHRGKLPLHYALFHSRAELSTIRALIAASSGTVDADGA